MFIHKDTHEEVDEGTIRSRFMTWPGMDRYPLSASVAAEVGYLPLTEISSGASEFQTATRVAAQFVNGQWQTAWVVVNKPISELASIFEIAVQVHMDASAKAKGYDNIVSACSYAGASNPFQAEGQAYVAWRGNVWAQCYADLAAIQAGTKTMPVSVAAYIATLPTAPV